jgi:putative spermidine/putrescine transport system ATP-binding protein
MAQLKLTNITKRYGGFSAVDDMTLDVRDGEFIVFLGPSGCGKTTTLRMIAGFIEPTDGRIRIGDRDLTSIPPYRRNLGVVFQNYAIFPHLTVFENVAFGLRRRRLPKDEIEAKTTAALERVQLDHLKDRLPKQLSGGQQQRVAIARALAIEPDVLLLDEPLSNLDAKLRQDVRHQIHRLQRDLGITTIMVTHDQEEALSLGDRLVVMNKGKVQQIGTPSELYEAPANAFVADFIGRANILRGQGVGGNGFKTLSGLDILCRNQTAGADAVVLRPEAISLSGTAGPGTVAGTVEDVTYLGSICEYRIRLDVGDAIIATASGRSRGAAFKEDAKIFVTMTAGDAYPLRSKML